MMLAILIVQFVGVPCAFLFGALAGRIGAKPAILLGLARLHADQHRGLSDAHGRAVLRAGRHGGDGAGRHPGAQPLPLCLHDAGPQVGGVLRLLQRLREVRRHLRPALLRDLDPDDRLEPQCHPVGHRLLRGGRAAAPLRERRRGAARRPRGGGAGQAPCDDARRPGILPCMDVLELTRALVRIDSTTGREGSGGRAPRHASWSSSAGPWSASRSRAGRFNVYATWAGRRWCSPPTSTPSRRSSTCAEDDDLASRPGQLRRQGPRGGDDRRRGALRAAGEERVGPALRGGRGERFRRRSAAAAARAARALPHQRRADREPAHHRAEGRRFASTSPATGRAAHSAYPDEGRVGHRAAAGDAAAGAAPPLPSASGARRHATLNIGSASRAAARPTSSPTMRRPQLLFRTVSRHGAAQAGDRGGASSPGSACGLSAGDSQRGFDGAGGMGDDRGEFRQRPAVPRQPGARATSSGPGTIRVAHTEEERIRKADLLSRASTCT